MTRRRKTGRRTIEEDGLIVDGLDPDSVGVWPDHALDLEEEGQRNVLGGDGHELDGLIERYVPDQDDRTILHCLRQGASQDSTAAVLSEVTGMEWTRDEVKRRRAALVEILRAATVVQRASEGTTAEQVRAVLTEGALRLWELWVSGANLETIEIVLRRGREVRDGGMKAARTEIRAITAKLRGADLGGLVDAVEDLRKARTLGGGRPGRTE